MNSSRSEKSQYSSDSEDQKNELEISSQDLKELVLRAGN